MEASMNEKLEAAERRIQELETEIKRLKSDNEYLRQKLSCATNDLNRRIRDDNDCFDMGEDDR